MSHENFFSSEKEELITREAEIEVLTTTSREINTDVQQLLSVRDKEISNLLTLSQDVQKKKYLERAELSECEVHPTESISRDTSEEKGKKLKLEEEVHQLQNDYREGLKNRHTSRALSDLCAIEELLDNFAAMLEKKISKPDNSNSPALILLERLWRLANERKRAMHSEAIRERLRDRITALKSGEVKERKRTLASGFRASQNLVRDFLPLRDKYLRYLDVLKEANLYFAHLVQNTMSHNGECDRESPLSLKAAFQTFTNQDTTCDDLRKRIAKESEEINRLQSEIDSLNRLEKEEAEIEVCDSVHGNEAILNREVELAKMDLRDLKSIE